MPQMHKIIKEKIKNLFKYKIKINKLIIFNYWRIKKNNNQKSPIIKAIFAVFKEIKNKILNMIINKNYNIYNIIYQLIVQKD